MPVVRKLAGLLGKRQPDKAPLILKPDAITKVIVNQDRKPEAARVNRLGYNHVSSLIRGDCPRALVIQRIFNLTFDNFVNGATRIMWEIGRAVEKHIRKQIIAALPPEQVYGCWKCPCHTDDKPGLLREGIAVSDDRCVKCGHPADIYVEVDLVDHTHKVIGHADTILILGGTLYPMEIKSLTNSGNANKTGDGFDTLTSPFVDHKLQVSSYHKMLVPVARRLGLNLGNEAVILYASKDFNGFKSPYPYKEFHISPLEHKPTIDVLFKESKDVFDSAKARVLPSRLTTCSNANTKVACKCPFVHYCFAVDRQVTPQIITALTSRKRS
jgi:hypothetical protein